MKIKIEFTSDEVKEIIKGYAIERFPVKVETVDVHVREIYSGATVEILQHEKEPEQEGA